MLYDCGASTSLRVANGGDGDGESMEETEKEERE